MMLQEAEVKIRPGWNLILLVGLALLLVGSVIACQPALSSPPLAQPVDIIPPPVVTGSAACDACDGKVNLSWDQVMAEDFGQYNIYVSESEIADVAGMTSVHQITDISINTYQVTGLEDGTKYYFAVAPVDENGNENTRVARVSATPTPMQRGTSDPDMYVDVYRSDMAWAGTTLLPDNHKLERPRIIEVNMLGEIVWEYVVPQHLRRYTNPGFDVELLPSNNVLFVLPKKGVYEIDRNGKVVWSYLDSKVTHDADRLPNGNTLVVCGGDDEVSQAQVKEVNEKGEVVWSWYAKDRFYKSPYKDIYADGWTHTNAVARLPNGSTLISPRNFNFVVEVDTQGSLVRTIGEGILQDQHDPEVLSDGNILVANHGRPHRAVELDSETGEIVWQSPGFERDAQPVRDANRLPNGNTLITGATEIVEVTPRGEIVWRLELKAVFGNGLEAARRGFYKAERIGIVAP